MDSSLRSMLFCTALGVAAGAFTGLAPAAPNKEHGTVPSDGEAASVDHLKLAARLLHDGHADRASRVLGEAAELPGIDRGRWHTLSGLAHAAREDHHAARREFDRAVELGVKDASVFLHLARSCFALQDHRATLRALARAKPVAAGEPAAWLMRAESYWHLKQRGRAIDVLEAGERRFPERSEFQRGQVFYLMEMRLYREALRVGERYLQRQGATPEDYVAVGEALRAAGQHATAQVVLEEARLRFPEHDEVLVQLAHAYLDAGKKLASALVFEQAARLDAKYYLEAAELCKEAGLLHRASWHNAKVLDQAAKTKQRLSLLIEAQDFEAVGAMLPKLSRLNLLRDESVRYALAYAFFMTHRLAEAEDQLKAISDPQLFESAMQLRQAMQRCRDAGWQCGT